MIRFVLPAAGLTAIVLATTACSARDAPARGTEVTPTGSGGERRFAVAGFDRLTLSTSADVEVHAGPAFSIVATGSTAALDMLRVRRDGKSVDFGQDRGVHWPTGGRLHIVVTMPRIAQASIGGSGSIAIDEASGNGFEGSIGGSGRLSVARVNVDTASFNIGGSGTVTAAGRARRTEVAIGGSGKVLGNALLAEDADVTIAGAGNVEVHATRKAEVTIMGSGNVTVAGGAKCGVTKMGVGNVRCG